MNPLVSVTIVTCNSRRFIEPCLDAVLAQDYKPLEIIIADNASLDGTVGQLSQYEGRIRLIRNARNSGFAAGQNQAIAASRGDWVLTLNPDVRMMPGFIERLVAAGRLDDQVGAVCGKLLRATPDLEPLSERRIDSTGIFFTPEMRHFDRGWNEPDTGYDDIEYVFGASGAAALFRREMIDDVSSKDGFFDPDFFAYREDADVAWRAQLLGWRCLYTPEAVGYHVRRVRQGSRRNVPARIKMHSVKNRFLMRLKNATSALYQRHWYPATCRDIMVAGGCFITEPKSLAAFWHLAKCLPRALAKRRQIMSRVRVSEDSLTWWFRDQPASQPFATHSARPSGTPVAAGTVAAVSR